jgi:hypothetical protein
MNVRKAEEWLHKEVEDPYPEVVTAMQERRAQLFLLTAEYHQVEGMLANGQIEDRDSVKLLGELDEKLYVLKIQNYPDLPEIDKKDMIFKSVLSRIFTKQEIEAAIKDEVLEETVLEAGLKIVEKSQDTDVGKKVLFISRGIVHEKADGTDDQA